MMKNANTTFPTWDFVRLLNRFGSSARVQHIITQHGLKPPPLKTINGWRQRNSIPPRWTLFLVNLALKNGLIENIGALKRQTPRQKFRGSLEELAKRRQAAAKPEWADL